MVQHGSDTDGITGIYCLHYVFLPRINPALKSFVELWNNHPVSTELNRTPNQLLIIILKVHYNRLQVVQLHSQA